MTEIRQSPFAFRVVERRGGRAGVIYRRMSDPNGNDRLQRIAALSPLAFTSAAPLIRDAIRASCADSTGRATCTGPSLATGPFHPLSADWGARVACFALLASGLRNASRLIQAAGHLHHADPDEAAWWLGLMSRDDNTRALRAFRILTEAVE